MWWHSIFAVTSIVFINPLSQVANVRWSHICHLHYQLVVSAILLCWTSSAPLERLQGIGVQQSSDLFRDATSGSGWAAQGHPQSCLKAACIFLPVYFGLLSWWKKNVFQSAVEHVINKDVCTLLPSFGHDESPAFCSPEGWCCFSLWMVLARWW